MLVELHIRDYAVVDDLTLSLGPGLNALTGETGAGKSIIVGALSLLIGERASSDVVRAGAERASVEAVFDLEQLPAVRERAEELGFRLEDGLLILRREVAAAGRNRAWVGGSPTTAGVVGELGSSLVDLHGQHEHQTLLRARDQRSILDAYGGSTALAKEVARRYRVLEGLRDQLEEREEKQRIVEAREDFLRFQLNEIDEAGLEPGEDDRLEVEIGRHENSEELARATQALNAELYSSEGAVTDRLAEAKNVLSRLVGFDIALRSEVERVDEALHLVSDVARALGDYATAVEFDPGRLEEVRTRLDRIFRLKRKYGPELADVLETAQRVRTELDAHDEAENDLAKIREEIGVAEAELLSEAAILSTKRGRAATELGIAVSEALPDLGLVGGRFEVELTVSDALSASGAESVEFVVSPNTGFNLMPLARIASGGELSRIMLALKAILASVDEVPVLVFDEIDSGVGGTVASSVAVKLARVAEAHQVFVVTHLPQVASRADAHLVVEKRVDMDITTTVVRQLNEDSRVCEIARMLGGDAESDASREHARELLASSSAPISDERV
ncbi:MAG TPA: DNA repair protein RecN [Gemmatimonadetes bacterium]|nr:DNA repair protein RecN [Gemmatimonadota bacterium]